MTNVDAVAEALAEAAYTLGGLDELGTLSAADALSALTMLAEAQRGADAVRDRLVDQLQAAPQGSEAHASWRAICRALGEPLGTVYGRWERLARGDGLSGADRPATGPACATGRHAPPAVAAPPAAG